MDKIDTALGLAVVAVLLAALLSEPSTRSQGADASAPAPVTREAQAARSEHEIVLTALLRLHLSERALGKRAPPSYLQGLQLKKGPQGYSLLLPQAAATEDAAEFKRFIWSFWSAYKEAPIPTVHAIYLGDAHTQTGQVRQYRVVQVADLHAGLKAGLSFDAVAERLMAGAETLSAEGLEGKAPRLEL